MILRIFFQTLRIALWLTLACTATTAHAVTDTQAIRDAVQTFMTGYINDMKTGGVTRAEFAITGLDNRLTFPDCPEPLQVDNKNPQTGSTRLTLKVSCQQGAAWSIFVPVAITAYRDVVIATQPLQRGSILSSSQLAVKEMDVSALRSQYFSDPAALNDKLVRRPITEGVIITADAIEEPIIIHRGDIITIIANAGSLTVKMQGTALRDGRNGEQISVRNQSSDRVIKATVKGPGEVLAIM
jgi:flagella basal body P-ring formation protein FlgA